eukprot:scaffold119699_cov32-Tisochrysis_lutea.AAC.5
MGHGVLLHISHHTDVVKASAMLSIHVSTVALCRWALVTVTTVGYGDAVPHTSAGRAVAAVAMFTGVVGISMSFSIISQVRELESGCNAG